MTLLDRPSRWSASDLADFFTCAHRAALERSVRSGLRERPAPSGEAAVIARRGMEHAAAYRAQLAAAGLRVVDVAPPLLPDEYAGAAAETRAAMAAGIDVIAHATFDHDGFVGVADLLVRVPGRSTFGAWSYEAVDVTLAASSRPAAVVQLCAYAEALAALCGTPFDEARVRGARGDGTVERFRVADFAALYRALRERFAASRRAPEPTQPEKIGACARCAWRLTCLGERSATDDVSLVANIRRDQVIGLREAGIATVAALGSAADAVKPVTMALATWEKLRDQAALQAAAARDGQQRYRLLPPEARSGFALLPPPSPGDLYFDMEGDPFVAGGLEYLFGRVERDANGTPQFTAWWAHDRAAERTTAASMVELIAAQRAVDPSMHVYHYASYERTALTRLCLGTPHEALLEQLFRDQVFVDLYAVVRGALRVSTPSYSIKSLELFYRGTKRASEVADAIGSVVAYEEYLRTGEARRLEEIAVYNRDDCLSTLELHQWLLRLRDEAYATFGDPLAEPSDDEDAQRDSSDDAELATLRESLAGAGSGEALLADLLEYHRRERRAGWREYFERCRTSDAELLDDAHCLAGLVPDPHVAPVRIDRSWGFALRFPAQRHRFRIGDRPDDPLTQGSAGEIVALTVDPDGSGTLVLKRGPKLSSTALPTALVPKEGARDEEQRKALRRLAHRLAAGDPCDDAQGALLFGRAPRCRSLRDIESVDATDPVALAALVDDLECSALVVQGPPGTGKTWLAARAIVALLEAGRRVGVAAGTHKAINHLLGEIERVAAARAYPLCGMKKSDDARPETRLDSSSDAIVDEGDARAFPPPPAVRLLAGTPALFAREALTGALDVLFVDEAGQLALADAIAISGAATTVVLLGDPQQLAHVTTGAHPAGAEASVLAHLLAGTPTVAAGRGVFLPRSYRMHSAVMRFVSDLMYEGRLESDPSCDRQRVIAPGTAFDGAGLRALPVVHRGCSNASPAEAAAIAGALGALRGSEIVGGDGAHRAFDLASDAIVVAPYNAQVATIRDALAAAGLGAVRVGTVDKFQGQEATIVFYSMTTSSGEDVPRDVEFLFDRHRLNVAISRARALAVLVYSPQLLELRPATVDHMRQVNALARLTELARAA